MPTIPVVENPTRRRRRRGYSAKQLRSGFGGRSRMSRRRSTARPATRRTARRRRSRNPALATLMNPRRRRRTTYRTYRRWYARPRRRRNAGLGSIMGFIHLPTALSVAGGIVTARMAPGLLAKIWPSAPQSGAMGIAVRVGGVLVVSVVAKKVFRSNQIATGIAAGGLGYILFDLANQYLLPQLGLSGLGSNYDYLTRRDLNAIGLSDYRLAPRSLSGVSPYEPVDEVLAA